MKPTILYDEAEAELAGAMEVYEKQRTGLGGEFRREFESYLERVRSNPLGYASEDDSGVRYCPLRRFPYTIVYVVLADSIWVAAVEHQRRRPGY